MAKQRPCIKCETYFLPRGYEATCQPCEELHSHDTDDSKGPLGCPWCGECVDSLTDDRLDDCATVAGDCGYCGKRVSAYLSVTRLYTASRVVP